MTTLILLAGYSTPRVLRAKLLGYVSERIKAG